MHHLLRSVCGIFLATALAPDCFAQPVATLEVVPKQRAGDMAVPVRVDLDAITYLPDSVLSLVRVKGRSRIPVAMQVEAGERRSLHWLIEPGAEGRQVFELLQGRPAPQGGGMAVSVEEGTLTLKSNDRNLLRYNYKTVYPPAGVDTVFRRSGFIHPLWSPHGQVLTRIMPKDHYHHFGIWNPWTHTLFEGDTVDFWNIKGRQGTVRFAHFTNRTAGPVFGEYAALHEHVAFPKGGGEKVALHEIQTVRIYRPEGKADYYIADLTIRLQCAGDSPIRLLAYRYGGLGWRTTEQWDNKNSTVLTSEGKTRRDADGSKARWCVVQGAVDQEQAGVVMMSFPTNYNHPEPLRIWPEDQYKRGDMFANFSPTKDRDWPLQVGREYVLKYRLLVFNGTFSKEKAELAWQHFAHPPTVTVKPGSSTKTN